MEALLNVSYFIIKTNHQSLKYLLEQRISTPLHQKWLTRLLGLDYDIQCKKGERMWWLMHCLENNAQGIAT